MSAGVITDWTVAEVHRFILNDIGGNVGKYADMFQENVICFFKLPGSKTFFQPCFL